MGAVAERTVLISFQVLKMRCSVAARTMGSNGLSTVDASEVEGRLLQALRFVAELDRLCAAPDISSTRI
jgi:hypothetical protein